MTMKTLHYTRPHRLSQLHDELLAALPALRPVEGVPVMRLEGIGEDIWIGVPDPTSEAPVAAVVTAHVPKVVPTVDLNALLQGIEGAQNVAQLKSAVVHYLKAKG